MLAPIIAAKMAGFDATGIGGQAATKRMLIFRGWLLNAAWLIRRISCREERGTMPERGSQGGQERHRLGVNGTR